MLEPAPICARCERLPEGARGRCFGCIDLEWERRDVRCVDCGRRFGRGDHWRAGKRGPEHSVYWQCKLHRLRQADPAATVRIV